MLNQKILDWQNSFNNFGISYSGSKNGELNSQFIHSIMEFENKYQAYGEVFVGNDVRMTVSEAENKFLNKKNLVIENTLVDKLSNNKSSNDHWIGFLSTDLPVVGKLYNGNIEKAAKSLEDIIGKYINKSMKGIIWDETKKCFNTTTDDIEKSLMIISKNKSDKITQVKSSLDQRFFEMSKILLKI